MKTLLPILAFLIAPAAMAVDTPKGKSPQALTVSAGKTEFGAYGFLLAAYSHSTRAMNSFDGQNLVAPTAVKLRSAPEDHDGRISLQVGQTRFGFTATRNQNVSAKIEFDFVDFSKSSPTTATVPRVRIANVEYKFATNYTLFMGQDWDIFSPVSPITYNFVGGYYRSGNSGFMRQQLGMTHTGQDNEFAVALGLPGSNVLSQESNLELGKYPTLAARYALLFGKTRVGVSGIAGKIIFNNRSNQDRNILGGNAYLDLAVNAGLNVKSELYYGKNLANTGALTISNGVATKSVSEIGGYLTFKQSLHEKCAAFGGIGHAKVLDQEDMPANGIAHNQSYKLGLEHILEDRLTAFIEEAYLHTKYHVGPQTRSNGSLVSTVGLYYPF